MGLQRTFLRTASIRTQFILSTKLAHDTEDLHRNPPANIEDSLHDHDWALDQLLDVVDQERVQKGVVQARTIYTKNRELIIEGSFTSPYPMTDAVMEKVLDYLESNLQRKIDELFNNTAIGGWLFEDRVQPVFAEVL